MTLGLIKRNATLIISFKCATTTHGWGVRGDMLAHNHNYPVLVPNENIGDNERYWCQIGSFRGHWPK